MTTRDFTIAFEFAIGIFALYLFGRRLVRILKADNERRDQTGPKVPNGQDDGATTNNSLGN